LDNYYKKINDAANFVNEKFSRKFDAAVILGSGLGKLMDSVNDREIVDYKDIPGFPVTTVEGHNGQLIVGNINGKNLLAMKGRFHYYEGYEIKDVVMPVRMFKKLGVKNLIVTNAAGGLNTAFQPGDLMVIKDHISLFAPSPLRGKNLTEYGTRFPDMTKTYNRVLIELAFNVSHELGIKLKEGVYAFVQGPMYETPAEIRALGILGADAVGMSTVPEVITANHSGMNVLGISCITNMAAGITDSSLNHEEVIAAAKKIEQDFSNLVINIISRID